MSEVPAVEAGTAVSSKKPITWRDLCALVEQRKYQDACREFYRKFPPKK